MVAMNVYTTLVPHLSGAKSKSGLGGAVVLKEEKNNSDTSGDTS